MNRRDWAIVAAIAGFGLAMTWQGARLMFGSKRQCGGHERSTEAAKGERVTAVEMAREAGISTNLFRAALRASDLSWHRPMDPWAARRDSQQHKDMIRVLDELRQRDP